MFYRLIKPNNLFSNYKQIGLFRPHFHDPRFAYHDIKFNGFRNILTLSKTAIRQNKTKTVKGGNFAGRHCS